MTKPRRDAHADQRGLADPTDERSNCGVGVVLDLEGGDSHETVADGIDLLINLEHRGTTGAEEATGDGAGIMIQRPDEFFEAVVDADLSEPYAVGSVFMPQDGAARQGLMTIFERTLAEHGLEVFHWRDVPTDNHELGQTALDSEPYVQQPFVRPTEEMDEETFDRTLYVARRAVENAIEELDSAGAGRFYICSLDRETLVYKGLLKATQLPTYYPDLVDDINQCYNIGVNDATLILTRKLLENLLIDILRKQYGKQEIHLYYRPDNHRFQNFSTLIDNFEVNLSDFQHLSGGLDSDFIDQLNAFRQDANAEAHSIETNITEDEIESYREQARHASRILFRVKKNI